METIMNKIMRITTWLFCLVLLSSCYEEYIKDFDNDAHIMTEALSEWMQKHEDLYWDPETNFDPKK